MLAQVDHLISLSEVEGRDVAVKLEINGFSYKRTKSINAAFVN